MISSLPIIFKKVVRKGDGVWLRLDSTNKVSSEELGELDKRLEVHGVLVLGDSLQEELQDEQIKEGLSSVKVGEPISSVTPSQELRQTVWGAYAKLMDVEPTKEEFNEFYEKFMRALVTKIKTKPEWISQYLPKPVVM